MSPRACIFCEIVRGDATCFRVYEDELALVFMDAFPVGDGHLLIVPKRHYENLFEVDEASLQRVVGHSRRLALALRRALSPDGIAVHQLNGAAAGQTVFHYHMHLIPRRHGDPLGFHGRRRADPAELREVAERIAEALAGIT